MSFDQYSSSTDLQTALLRTGYQTARPVQQAILSRYAQGEDLFISASAGSGKTTACLIAALEHLLRTDSKKDNCEHPRVIIMVPGREQGHHVIRTFKEISRFIPKTPSIALCPNPYRLVEDEESIQPRTLSSVDIVVATPENLVDCIKEGKITLNGVRTIIYKNADQLLDAGYWHEMDRIHQSLPPAHQSVFLATHNYEGDLAEISRLLQNAPFKYSADNDTKSYRISERIHIADSFAHKKALLDFIVRDGEVTVAVIITNTAVCAKKLSSYLQQEQLPNTLLSRQGAVIADLALTASQKKYLPIILIGTHDCIRAHHPRASHLINFNFPRCPDDYFGRFNYLNTNLAHPAIISLVDKSDQKKLSLLENSLDKPLLHGTIPGLEPRSTLKNKKGKYGRPHKDRMPSQSTIERPAEYSGYMRSNTRRGHNAPFKKAPNEDSNTKPLVSAQVPGKTALVAKKNRTVKNASTSQGQRPMGSQFGRQDARPTQNRYQTHYAEAEPAQKQKSEPVIKVQKKPSLTAEKSSTIVEKIKSSRIAGKLGLSKK